MQFLVGEATAPLVGILLATALFAMSAMHEIHVSVLSEPLFLTFVALTLAVMVSRRSAPWLAGLWAALAAMTRYAGLSVIGAVVLWSVARAGTRAERVRRGVWSLLPAAVLEGLWFVRTKLVATAEPIRRLAYYGDLGPSIKQGATTLMSWLVPDPAGALAAVGTACGSRTGGSPEAVIIQTATTTSGTDGVYMLASFLSRLPKRWTPRVTPVGWSVRRGRETRYQQN